MFMTLTFKDLEIAKPNCEDSPSDWYDNNGSTYNCAWYAERASRCTLYGSLFENGGKVANEACCACGGGTRTGSDSSAICTTTFAGSYGNVMNGTHAQDYSGGVVVGPEDTLTMFGNTWKAYELCQPYRIRKSSVLKFDFVITDEAEGHAICLDEGEIIK